MSRIVIIAVCGEMESGKGSATNALIEEGFFRVALGDPIKWLLTGGGPDHPLLKDLGKAEWPPRRAWQTLGDESRIEADRPKVWVDVAVTYMTYLALLHPEPVRRFVVSDLRREFERQALANFAARHGGVFEAWKIVRPGVVSTSTHSSEIHVKEVVCDQTLVNDGARRDLVDAVRDELDALLDRDPLAID